MWVGIIIVPCWNSFIVALMMYVITQLDLINYKLANIQEYTDCILYEAGEKQELCESNIIDVDRLRYIILIDTIKRKIKINK